MFLLHLPCMYTQTHTHKHDLVKKSIVYIPHTVEKKWLKLYKDNRQTSSESEEESC